MKTKIWKEIILSHKHIWNKISVAAGVMLILSAILLSQTDILQVMHTETKKANKKTVVIDPGHGGDDPGKIGINQALEKDVNLEIAKKVKILLEQNDIEVIMTRENGEGLYEPGTSNKKVQDLKRRLSIMETEQPDLCVSIHQNSYHQESIHGAQVFYYETSEPGKYAANCMQRQLVRVVDKENKRVEKANTSYFLLKKTRVPIIIVECGFLSNTQEAEKLVSEAYQNQVAWGIHMGILEYLNTMQEKFLK